MLCSYEELPISFGFLGAVPVDRIYLVSTFRLWLQSSYQKKTLLVPFYAVFRYLAATKCISGFR